MLPSLLAASASPATVDIAGTIHAGHWLGFAAFVAVMLTLDLTVFHKKAHDAGARLQRHRLVVAWQ